MYNRNIQIIASERLGHVIMYIKNYVTLVYLIFIIMLLILLSCSLSYGVIWSPRGKNVQFFFLFPFSNNLCKLLYITGRYQGSEGSIFFQQLLHLHSFTFFLYVVTAESPSHRVQEVLDYTQSLVSVSVGGGFHFPFVAVFSAIIFTPYSFLHGVVYIYGFLMSLFSSSSCSWVMADMTGLQDQRGK